MGVSTQFFALIRRRFKLGTILTLCCFFTVPFLVFAAGPPYLPGETLDPSCNPTSTICTVIAPPTGSGSAAGLLTYWNTTSTVSSTPLLFWNDAGLQLGIGTSTAVANALITIATTSNIFTVLSNGNVGIGTTAPNATLNVSGTLAVSGNINSSSSITINGVAVSTSSLVGVTNSGSPYNTLLGAGAGATSTGAANTFIGYQSGNVNTTGNYNTANGMYSLISNTTGTFNTAIGYYSLYSNITGSGNVALGTYAGRYETGSNAFYVGNTGQSSLANDKAYSLLYGNFAGVIATTTNQFLTVNGNLYVSGVASSTELRTPSSTITGLVFTNATGTNLTITGLASTSQEYVASSTIAKLTFVNASGTGNISLSSGYGLFPNLYFTSASGTNISASGYVSSTNVSSTNITATGYGLFPNLYFTSATGTNLTITGIASTSQVYEASSTITKLTFVNASGTGNISLSSGYGLFPNLYFTSATGTNITITGIASTSQAYMASSTITGLVFVNATSTSGNLGVGTINIGTSTAASSTALLTVATGTNIFTVGNRGVVLINATSGIYNTSLFMATSSLIVCARSNCNASSTASTTDTVAFFASTGGNATSNSIIARGSISAGQSDIGEYANVVGDKADYEAGDVLSVSSAEPGKFEKSATAYDTKLAGVVTETAGLVAGGGEDNHGSLVIALQGRLPVKVSGANGPIAVGDYLTSSDVPGYAQKATAVGRVVAIAMEAFNGATAADKGKILAFIEKSYYPGANIASLSSAPVGQSLQSGSAGVGSALNTYTFDPNMVYSFENLKAQNFEVGSSAKPSGITIYDTQTKNPYCIIVENGILKAVPGKCGEGVTTGIISAPSFVPATNVNTNSTVTATASTSETTSSSVSDASGTEAAAAVDTTSTDSATAPDVSSSVAAAVDTSTSAEAAGGGQ